MKTKIKNKWEDITLEELVFILEAQESAKDPEELTRKVVSHLYDCDCEAIPYTDYLAMIAGLNKFIGKPVTAAKISGNLEYTINGSVYVLDSNPAAFTTAQYIDFTNMVKDYKNLVGVMTTVLVPKGHKYMDGYDIMKVNADLRKMGAVEAMGIANFFRAWSNRSIATILRCLTYRMRKRMTKEQKLKVRRLLRTLSRSSASSHM